MLYSFFAGWETWWSCWTVIEDAWRRKAWARRIVSRWQTLWIIAGVLHWQWKSWFCCCRWSLWALIVRYWADCCHCFVFTAVLLLLWLFLLQAKGDYPQESHGWLLKWAVLYLLWHRVDMMIFQLLLFMLDHHLPSHLCCDYDLKCCLMNCN